MRLKIGISKKDRASGRFLEQVHAALSSAATLRKNESGLSQSDIAKALECDRSKVSRILWGGGNPTARTIGEIAWALRMRPTLVLTPIEGGDNVKAGVTAISLQGSSKVQSSSVNVISHRFNETIGAD